MALGMKLHIGVDVKQVWPMVWRPLLPTCMTWRRQRSCCTERKSVSGEMLGMRGLRSVKSIRIGKWAHCHEARPTQEASQRASGEADGRMQVQCEGQGGTSMFYVKQMFSYNKTRYRGLAKNESGWRCCLDLPTYCVGSLVWCESHGIRVSGYDQSDTSSILAQS